MGCSILGGRSCGSACFDWFFFRHDHEQLVRNHHERRSGLIGDRPGRFFPIPAIGVLPGTYHWLDVHDHARRPVVLANVRRLAGDRANVGRAHDDAHVRGHRDCIWPAGGVCDRAIPQRPQRHSR